MLYQPLTPCSLEQIALSGQCFRMEPQPDGWWRIPAGARCIRVRQLEDALLLDTDEAEFAAFWRSYFDWDTDYAAICAAVPEEDAFLRAAVTYGSGLRILRQDLWETLITFVISQNNNIPRIRSCVEALCHRWGERRTGPAGEYYTFPDKTALARAELPALRAIGLGYRDRYVYAIAHSDWDPQTVAALPPDEACAALLALPGVGPKVAACVRLFGLHDHAAFPVDTWIRKVVQRHYGGRFPLERYAGNAGILQQYLFFYGRSHAGGASRSGAPK